MVGTRAKLAFLSGSKAGTNLELSESTVTIGRKADRTIVFSPEDVLVSTEHCSISYRNGRYVLRDDGSRNGTFVNSQMVKERVLEHGDLIQLGPGGPSIRFVVESKPGAVATVDVAALQEREAKGLAAAGREGELAMRTRDLVALTYYKLTTRLRRTVLGLVALGVAALLVVLWVQQRSHARMEAELAGLAASVATSTAGMQQDLAALDARYAVLRDAMVAEGKTLGKGSRLNLDAISEYSRGVALVVVAYGFTRPGSPQLLRYAVDASGKTVMTRGADGRMIPAASFEASGPPVQHYGTATAFLVDSDGYVVTNRWVTEPWVGSAELAALRARGLAIDGHLMEMRAYLPPGDRSFALFVHRKADSADVAVLRLIGKPTGTPVLRLAPDSALVRPGDQLLSIGYPATAADLLFRADTAERNDIMRRAGDNPWQLVQELGRRKMIQPLVGDGTVKTTTATGLTHTAGGVIGGSGGPLIDAHRLVVAVQRGGGSADAKAAALPGVRIAYARDILPYRVQHSGSAER